MSEMDARRALPGPADDASHMARALAEARAAVEHGDVPIGAIVVRGGEAIAKARNRREADSDPTAHAEILALRDAGARVASWRLSDCAMYVTLEPCVMCAGAIVLARMPLVVFAAPDPKAGAVISIAQVFEERGLNHHPKWRMGVLRSESEALLKGFFGSRRAREQQ
jgi:tRNA(adenine34) deaminase